MRILTILASIAVAASLAGEAAAADRGIFLGGSIGRMNADEDFPFAGDAYDTEDSAYKVIAGVRLFDWFAVEASYLDLGEVVQTRQFPDDSNFHQKQKGIDAFGVFLFEIGKIDLFAKTGVVKWKSDGSYSSFAGPIDISDEGTDVAWGLGVQGRLDNLAVRFEYEHFGFDTFFDNIENPTLISVGATWTFL